MSIIKKKTTDVKLEAVKILWGTEQCRTYDVNGLATYDGKYFQVNLIKEDYTELKGYVFLDTGASVDPTPAGLTLIATASVVDLDSDEDNAIAIKAALDASAFTNLFVSEIDSDDLSLVRIQNKIFGAVSNGEDAGDSQFVYTLELEALGGDLGKTEQGGVTLNMETSTAELKSDQTAELLLGEINQGNLTTIEMSLIEITKERLKTVLGSVVGDIVDMGVDGEYIGLGTSKLFQELSALGGRMVLHPLRISDVTNRSEDWSFHLTAPIPNSLNFSGTEQQALEMTFKPYVDETKDARASVGGFGDWLALINL